MCDEELSDRVRAIDFEALVCRRELLDESEVVKCSGDVKKLTVESKASLVALLSCEKIYPDGVVEEQIRGMPTQKIGGLPCKQRIRYCQD